MAPPSLAIWSTALTSALPAHASWAPLSTVRRCAMNPSGVRCPLPPKDLHSLQSLPVNSHWVPDHRSSRSCCLGYGSSTCYSLGFGSHGFRPLVYGVCGFPSLSHRSQFCNPMYVASGSCQTSCDQPTFYIWLLLLFSF